MTYIVVVRNGNNGKETPYTVCANSETSARWEAEKAARAAGNWSNCSIVKITKL